RGAGAEERPAPAALHPDVVVDERHQADEETGREQEGKPREASVTAALERILDRSDRLAHHVPEEKDEDSGRHGGEERLRRWADVLHPAEREADEDGHAGDRAEAERLKGAHCKGHLTGYDQR